MVILWISGSLLVFAWYPFFFNWFQINSNKTGGKNINMLTIHPLNPHSAVSDHEIRSLKFKVYSSHQRCNPQESLSPRILSLSNGWLNDKFIWGAVHFDRKMPAEFCSKRTHSHMQNPFPPTIGCFKLDGGVISSTHWKKPWNHKIFLWKMSESSSNQQFFEIHKCSFSVVQLFTKRIWVRKTWHHPKGNDGLLSTQGL